MQRSILRILFSFQNSSKSYSIFSESRYTKPKLNFLAAKERISRKAKVQPIAKVQPVAKVQPEVNLKNLYPWKTKEQFLQHLADNVTYNQDGLIAINKPFGVPVQKNLSSTIGPNECPFAIEEVLIPLASLLNVKQLVPVKMAERYSSGISLFTTHKEIDERIKKSLATNKANKTPTLKYLAITIGEPKPSKNEERIALGMFEHKDLPGKSPILTREYSKSKVADGLLREFKVKYETLMNGKEESSLVEIDVFSMRRHFLRVYFSYLLSPILGDHLFGNRVQTIMGKRLAISPIQADRLGTFQKIPKDILTLLGLTDSARVPTCLHLNQMQLARFTDKNSNLVLTAEPPIYFQQVCKTLDLNLQTTNTIVQSAS